MYWCISKAMSELRDRDINLINSLKAEMNVSLSKLALLAHVSDTTVTRFLNNDQQQSLSSRVKDKLCQAAGYKDYAAYLKSHSEEPDLVPIVGVIKEGGKVFYLQPIENSTQSPSTQPVGLTEKHGEAFMVANTDLLEKVVSPVNESANLQALKIEDDSMYPAYKKGWVVFYEQSRVIPKIDTNRDYIACLKDGSVYIRQISSSGDTYTLTAHNAPPMFNVDLSWCSPVNWTKQG